MPRNERTRDGWEEDFAERPSRELDEFAPSSPSVEFEDEETPDEFEVLDADLVEWDEPGDDDDAPVSDGVSDADDFEARSD